MSLGTNIKILKPSEVRVGMVVRFVDEFDNPYAKNWIVIKVTKDDLKKGVNAECEGLYGFSGFWYGKQPMKRKSYGKITPITSDVVVIRSTIISMNCKELKELLN